MVILRGERGGGGGVMMWVIRGGEERGDMMNSPGMG